MIIQFIHPGKEHTARSGAIWNNGAHKRKYLEVNGQHVEAIDTSPKKDKLFFWGEWEAQSYVEPAVFIFILSLFT